MTEVSVGSISSSDQSEPTERATSFTSARLSALVFGVVVVVALPVILHTNREQWFFFDEWDFLADRSLTDPGDLLRPHNEHWSTIPIILYRLVWQAVGLDHYWPYQMLTIGAHLTTAILLRVVMRRAGVDPWIATAAATLFAFFGSGRQNIGWGFQIGFTGTLAFGLAHLLLADHDGPYRRRDLAGLACGLAALMCSGIGISMTVATGTAVLIRRGWRTAALHTAPLAAVFGAWYLIWGRGHRVAELVIGPDAFRLARNMLTGTLGGIGGHAAGGAVVAVVTVIGIALLVHDRPGGRLRRTHAATAGLLAAAVVQTTLIGVSRAALGTESASRYVYLLAAMLLPTVAVAATAIAARWRPFIVVTVVGLVAAGAVNTGRLAPTGSDRLLLGTREVLLLARSRNLDAAPRSLHPAGQFADEVTVGWLIDARDDGKVPEAPADLRRRMPTADLRLSLERLTDPAGRSCRVVHAMSTARLRAGEVLRVPAPSATLVALDDGGPTEARLTFETDPVFGEESAPGADGGPEVRVRAVRPLDLAVAAPGAHGPTEICADR